ncbi:hypothetical protein NUSPORA_01779 [Nucleospora cyclopteri]
MLNKKEVSELQLKKKTRFPISRIKKIIQRDEDIGKTSSAVPVILSKACELFLMEIVSKSKKSKKITKSDLLEILKEEKYKFLEKLVINKEESK